MYNFKNNKMSALAEQARFKPNVFLQIPIFLVVMFLTQMVAGVVAGVAMIPIIFELLPLAAAGDMTGYTQGIMELATNPPVYIVLISLAVTVATTVGAIVYCRFIERRPLASMGLGREKALPSYLVGYGIGAGIFSAAVLICVATGSLSISVSGELAWGYVLLFFLGYLLQGMSEEVLVRGYLMISMGNRAPLSVAVGLSSLIFASMHLLNSGITPLAFFNLFLFGAFAGLFALRLGQLWTVCALHSAWNFFQGNVFGISVSGMGSQPSVFSSTFMGSSLVNGGSFGLEGGLAVTTVLVIATALVVFWPAKKTEGEDSECSEKLSPPEAI